MKQGKERGITLIALVVTIIILLILAGVTLSLVAGENGILRRATHAVDVNEKSSAEEQANLVLADIVTKYYEEKYVNHNAEVGTMDAYIQEQLATAKTTEGGYIVQFTGEKVEVSKNGQTISSGSIANGKVDWTGEEVTILKWKELEENINSSVANQERMKEVMNSKSEVNYMVTNNTILTAVANSEVAMKELSNSKYASYAVIKNEEARKIILASDYRNEFDDKNIVSPLLDGYVDNLTYSSENSALWAVWKVFDRNENTQWGTENNIPLPNWVQYDLEKEYLIYKVVVVNAFQSGMGPQSGNVYFDDVKFGSYEVNSEKEPYTIENVLQGRKIKVTCDKYNWQNAQSYLSEVYVYGVEVVN